MTSAFNLSIRQVLEMLRALNSLDAVRSGKDEITPLEFTGPTRAKIMANVQALEPHRLAHEATDRALAKQHAVFQGIDVTPEVAKRIDAYKHELEESLNLEVTVELHRIALSALLNKPGDGKTIRQNLVPQSVLNRLAPILDFNTND